MSVQQLCKTFAEHLEPSLCSGMKLVVQMHPDAVAAAAILSKALLRKQVNYSLCFCKNVEETMAEVSLDSSKMILFVGLGVVEYDLIVNSLKKQFFILDNKSMDHVLPNVLAVATSSLSSLAYFVSVSLDEENKEYAYLPLIEAAFSNKEVHEEIKKDALLLVEERSCFNLVPASYPLHKLLEVSVDPFLPGISGSQDGCFSFFRECNLNIKDNNKFRSLLDLSQEEAKHLTNNIALKTAFTFTQRTTYLLKGEPEDSFLRDLAGFYLVLEGCVKAGNPALAFSLCIDPKRSRTKAMDVLIESRRTLISSLQWWYIASSSGYFTEKDNVILVNTAAKVRESNALNFVKIILKKYQTNKMMFFLFPLLDGKVKVIAGSSNPSSDLKSLVTKLLSLGYKVTYEDKLLFFDLNTDQETQFNEQALSLGDKVLPEEIVQ